MHIRIKIWGKPGMGETRAAKPHLFTWRDVRVLFDDDDVRRYMSADERPDHVEIKSAINEMILNHIHTLPGYPRGELAVSLAINELCSVTWTRMGFLQLADTPLFRGLDTSSI